MWCGYIYHEPLANWLDSWKWFHVFSCLSAFTNIAMSFDLHWFSFGACNLQALILLCSYSNLPKFAQTINHGQPVHIFEEGTLPSHASPQNKFRGIPTNSREKTFAILRSLFRLLQWITSNHLPLPANSSFAKDTPWIKRALPINIKPLVSRISLFTRLGSRWDVRGCSGSCPGKIRPGWQLLLDNLKKGATLQTNT